MASSTKCCALARQVGCLHRKKCKKGWCTLFQGRVSAACFLLRLQLSWTCVIMNWRTKGHVRVHAGKFSEAKEAILYLENRGTGKLGRGPSRTLFSGCALVLPYISHSMKRVTSESGAVQGASTCGVDEDRGHGRGDSVPSDPKEKDFDTWHDK